MPNNTRKCSECPLTPITTCDLIWFGASEILTRCLFTSSRVQIFSKPIPTGQPIVLNLTSESF